MEEVHFTTQQFHAAPSALTLEQLEAAIRGKLQVYIDGHVHPMQLSRKELAAYERAKQCHFVVEESGTRSLETVYYQYCAIKQICYVRVVFHSQKNGHDLPKEERNIHEELATVWYDLFRLRHGLTPKALQDVRESFERVRPGMYQETHIHLSMIGGCGVVPEYASEKLAIALWQIFETPQTHTPELFPRHDPPQE